MRSRGSARRSPCVSRTFSCRTAVSGCGCTKRAASSTKCPATIIRSEEHTSELQSLMRISYAVFCLKNKKEYTYHSHQILASMITYIIECTAPLAHRYYDQLSYNARVSQI